MSEDELMRRPLSVVPAELEDAWGQFRVAAIARIHGKTIVKRFHQAHNATIYNLDCVSEKISVLRRIGRDQAPSHMKAFFYTVMNTDEFFRHYFSVRENLIQEINFVFGPGLDWSEQGPGFEKKVREHLGKPDWWEVIELEGSEWWDRAREYRHHVEHKAIPTFRTFRIASGPDDNPQSADYYLALLGPNGGSTYVPLLRDLDGLRSHLWTYCRRVYSTLAEAAQS